MFSPCIHTAGESKKSNEYQERRSTKSPLCRLPPAQPCPADCRVTLQELHTPCSAGKTCSALCPGQALLPPLSCAPVSEPGRAEHPLSHLLDPTSGSHRPSWPAGRTHSTFLSPVQLPNRALTLCQGRVRFTSPSRAPFLPIAPWLPKSPRDH